MLASVAVQRRVPHAQHQAREHDRPDEKADRHGRRNAHPLRFRGDPCKAVIGRDEIGKIAVLERAVVVYGRRGHLPPLSESKLLLAKGFAGTHPHRLHPRKRRLAVAFEKRQLGRIAKPELGLAGIAPEGAHRLEP